MMTLITAAKETNKTIIPLALVRYEMIIAIKEVHHKPRLHVPVNLLFKVWQQSWSTPQLSSLCVRAHEQYH